MCPFVVCAVHQVCGEGEWAVTAGTATTDTKCRMCPKGTFRATSPTSGKAEIETEVCKIHKTCAAGEWTDADGTNKTDTQCKTCSSGRYRDSAPVGKSEEIETEVCEIHKRCAAGEWTEADGTDKVDTRCKACSSGRYRGSAPEGKSKELETEVCKTHRRCAAGEWTDAAGTNKTDTQCKACSSGRYRDTVPEGKSKEIEVSVCTACTRKDLFSDQPGLSVCKECRPGESGLTEKWTVAGPHVLCADITPPVITLNGDAIITVGQGLAYKDPHAVSDRNERVNSTVCNRLEYVTLLLLVIHLTFLLLVIHLTCCVVVKADEVNTAVVQNYTVVYTASDAAGNTGYATRTVVVGKRCHPTPMTVQS